VAALQKGQSSLVGVLLLVYVCFVRLPSDYKLLKSEVETDGGKFLHTQPGHIFGE